MWSRRLCPLAHDSTGLTLKFAQNKTKKTLHLHCTKQKKHYIYTALHYIVLHYTALHCSTLHCTALHCSTLQCTIRKCTQCNKICKLFCSCPSAPLNMTLSLPYNLLQHCLPICRFGAMTVFFKYTL